MKLRILLAGCGLLAATLTVVHFVDDAPPDEVLSERLDAMEREVGEVERMRATIDRQNRDLTALSQKLASLTPVPSSRHAAPEPAPDAVADEQEAIGFGGDEDPRDDQPATPGQESYALEEQLEASYQQETGPAWGAEATDEANAVIDAALPTSSSIHTMECRGDLCRVEIEHLEEGGDEAFVRQWLDNGSRWNGPVAMRSIDRDDGQRVTVAYLGRPGGDATPWRVP